MHEIITYFLYNNARSPDCNTEHAHFTTRIKNTHKVETVRKKGPAFKIRPV